MGGAVQAVAVYGKYVYAGVGNRLVTLLVLDQGRLKQIGSSAPFPHEIQDVKISGTYAYVAAGDSGLRIVDISNPVKPLETGFYDSPGYARGVAVLNHVAYLADGPFGMKIVDISDKRSPRETGTVYDKNYAFDVAVAGKHAYIAAAGAGLLIADITSAQEPKEAGGCRTPGYAFGIAVSGNTAFIADGREGVRIIDVTHPGRAKEIGFYRTPGQATHIAVAGNRAYVADAFGGLRILDVKNASKPIEAGAFELLKGNACKTVVSNDTVYFADKKWGAIALDVQIPSKVYMKGFYSYTFPVPANLPPDILAGNNEKEVSCLLSTGIMNCSKEGFFQPEAGVTRAEMVQMLVKSLGVVPVKSISTVSRFADVPKSHMAAGYIDAACINGIIEGNAKGSFRPGEMITLSETVAMILKILNRQGKGKKPEDIVKSAVDCGLVRENHFRASDRINREYAAKLLSRAIFEITDAKSGKTLAQSVFGFFFEGPVGYVRSTAASGDYVYAACGKYGFAVIDVSSPSNPLMIGHYDLSPANMVDVEVQGDYAYLISTSPGYSGDGLYIFNIANPVRPVLAAFYPNTTGGYRDLRVMDKSAYIATEKGFEIVDVSDPKRPVKLGYLQIDQPGKNNDLAVGVSVYDKTAFVTCEMEGFSVIDISNTREPRKVSTVINTDSLFYRNSVVQQQRLYINAVHSIHVYECSEKNEPNYMAKYKFQEKVENIAVTDHVIFAALGDKGISAVNIEDPDNPLFSDLFPTYGTAIHLSVSGRHLYISDGDGGMVVVETSFVPGVSANSTASKAEGVNGSILLQDLFHSRYAALVPDVHLGMSNIKLFQKLQVTGIDNQIIARVSDNQKKYVKPMKVTSRSDRGAGTLRWCLENAQSGSMITFDSIVFPSDSPGSIILNTPLPVVKDYVAIDASNAGVILNGSQIKKKTGCGLILGNGCTVKGLQIMHFPGDGIYTEGHNNVIGGDRTKGSSPSGEGNVIIGNGRGNYGCGISLNKSRAYENIVIGNNIGVDSTGREIIGNVTGHGVFMLDGASRNIVGGASGKFRNISSGNGECGVSILGERTNNNYIVGNYIGTDTSGTRDFGNTCGIAVETGAYNNLIHGNLCSGNEKYGIVISDLGSNYNTVTGNIIGLDSKAQSIVRNNEAAIFVGYAGSAYNRIGGKTPGERNIIFDTLSIDYQAAYNFVAGNYFGTDSTGGKVIRNTGRYIDFGLADFGRYTFIGGSTSGEGNVISGDYKGLLVASRYSYIAGNYIGTGADGLTAISERTGLTIRGAKKCFIQGNTLRNNGEDPVFVGDGSENTIR